MTYQHSPAHKISSMDNPSVLSMPLNNDLNLLQQFVNGPRFPQLFMKTHSTFLLYGKSRNLWSPLL